MSEESVHARSHHIGNITIVTDPKEGTVRMKDHNQEIVLEVDEEPEKMYHAFLKAIIDRVEYAEKYAKALSQAKMFLSWLVDSNKLDGHQAVAKEKLRHITQVLKEGPHEKAEDHPPLELDEHVRLKEDIVVGDYKIPAGWVARVVAVGPATTPNSTAEEGEVIVDFIRNELGSWEAVVDRGQIKKVDGEWEGEKRSAKRITHEDVERSCKADQLVKDSQERGRYDADYRTVSMKVKGILADKLGLSSHPPQVYNIRHDLGADSLDVVEIVMTVEQKFDIIISDEEAQSIRTVRDLVNLVHQKTLF